MRSIYGMFLVSVLAPFSLAYAQRQDTTSARADSLRHQIEERFASRAQERLGLNNDQTAKLKATSQQFGARRGELRDRGRRLHEAMTAQLKPGVAANQDSVAKLTDAMIELKLAETQLAREEIREQSKYLNPVQRAQLYVMRERFAHRIREVHGHRGHMGGWHRGKHGGELKGRHGDRSRPRVRQTPEQEGSGRI